MKRWVIISIFLIRVTGTWAQDYDGVRTCPFTVNALTTQTCPDTQVTGELASLVSGGVAPYTFAQQGSAVNGTVTIDTNTGYFVFTPTTGFRGTASFQCTVTDSTACLSGPATVTINVVCCQLSDDSFVNYYDSLYFNAVVP